jgi:hypothetical protein
MRRVVSSVDEPVQEVDEGNATAPAEPRASRSSPLPKLAALVLTVVLGATAFFLSDHHRSAPLEGASAPPRTSLEEADPSGPSAAVPSTDAAGPGTATSGLGAGAAPAPPQAPRVHLVTLGYSATPRLRVAALMINGGLPVMLHEGESDRGIEVSTILSDRVYFRYAGHTYVANLKD